MKHSIAIWIWSKNHKLVKLPNLSSTKTDSTGRKTCVTSQDRGWIIFVPYCRGYCTSLTHGFKYFNDSFPDIIKTHGPSIPRIPSKYIVTLVLRRILGNIIAHS